MEEVVERSRQPVAGSWEDDGNPPSETKPISTKGTNTAIDDNLSDTDEIGDDRLSIEDVSSLLEPALSLTATRYRSARTPAVDKAKVLEEAGGYFDEGDAITSEESSPAEEPSLDLRNDNLNSAEQTPLSLGNLPSPQLIDPEIPVTPWVAGPKKLVIEKPQQPQSALQGVFSSRARSLSGGAEALKKMLPKGLPSMAHVGSLFSSSSNSPTRSKFSSQSSSTVPREMNKLRKQDRSSTSQTSSGATTPRYESIIATATQSPPPRAHGHHSPNSQSPYLRRVNSDESVLYQSLSRASSLGDDTRFEAQREMVNSRVKAIRDSLQDRSSFRMPEMPTMPSMPNFGFSMNFLHPSKLLNGYKGSDEVVSDDLPSSGLRKHPNQVANPLVASAMTATAIGKPDVAEDTIRPVMGGANSDYLDRALEHLTGDVVIMGGYRGSVLRSTRTKRQLWVPVKVGLNIRKVDLEVGLEPEADEKMEETIYSSGMLQNIGPVDISKRLFKRLNDSENARKGKLRIWDYGYDWRLSPHLLSRKLREFLEKLPSNQPGGSGALVIAHSLGGLITRHVANHYPQLFSGIIYAGVPHACVNILGPLRNGDAVMLSSRVLTAQVNFTLRTSFLLLPEDGACFFDINTKEKYPVDFFNVDDWIKYRLSPCTDPPLPPRNPPQQQGPFESFMQRSAQKRKSFSQPSNDSSLSPSDEQRDRSSSPLKNSRAADVVKQLGPDQDRTIGMQMDNKAPSVSTIVTIPRDAAIKYLTRVLGEIKAFKQEMHHNPKLQSSNRYPPLAVIYGKSIPTVFGAKVDGREGIPCSDSYDNLAFASGDGVCLAKEAMLPAGYKCVSGGRISSDRGHVTLLGDLNAIGRAIEAVVRGRGRGIGKGISEDRAPEAQLSEAEKALMP